MTSKPSEQRLSLFGAWALAFGCAVGGGLTAMTAPDSPSFDLVLTDMWMPNLDGEGLVRAIRNNPALASTRVIVVTADVEMRTKAVEMGFDDILLKPVTSVKLAKTLAGRVASPMGNLP